MTDINFKCPECGGHKIEEIMINVTVASEIGKLHESGGVVFTDYGEQTNEDGEIDRYQCGGCGYTIVDGRPLHRVGGVDERALVDAIKKLNNKERLKEGDLDEDSHEEGR